MCKLGLYTLPQRKFYNLTIITMVKVRTEIKWNVYWKLKATWNFYRKNSRIFEEVECLKCWYKHYVDRPNLLRWGAWCRKCSHLKHWLAETRFYQTRKWLNQRCKNSKSPSYKEYWARWIRCEWNNFEEYKMDMYESYVAHVKEHGEKETSIDRIDVNWNYCKENCRWATNEEQANNKQKKVWVRKFARETGIPRNRVVYWYYYRGLTLEQIKEKFKPTI